MDQTNKPQNERGVGLFSPEEVVEVSKVLTTEQPAAAEPTEMQGDDEVPQIEEDDLEEESSLSYEEGLIDGLELNPEFVTANQETILKKREDTRSRLAISYVIATFSVFVLAMIIAVIDGLARQVSIIDNLKEIVPLVSGVFLGSLGFVLGYYFRKNEDEA